MLKIKQSKSVKHININNERGAALIEFVISFMPFMVILMGVMGLLWVSFHYAKIEYMANEAVLYATETVSNFNASAIMAGQTCSNKNFGDRLYTGEAGALSNRHCAVYQRLTELLKGEDLNKVFISVGIDQPCSYSNMTSINNALNNSSTAIALGGPRQLIALCLRQSANPIDNLLPLPINVTAMAVARSEPSV